MRSSAGVLELVFDPLDDVRPPVSQMPADAEAWRSFSSIPPLVQGGHRDSEVVGEVFHGE